MQYSGSLFKVSGNLIIFFMVSWRNIIVVIFLMGNFKVQERDFFGRNFFQTLIGATLKFFSYTLLNYIVFLHKIWYYKRAFQEFLDLFSKIQGNSSFASLFHFFERWNWSAYILIPGGPFFFLR